MSNTSTSPRWILEDASLNLDTTEGDGVAEIRKHYVFAIYKKQLASAVWQDKIGVGKRTLSYYVGETKKTLTLPGGGPMFVCVADGWTPHDPGTPGEYVIQRQVWEYYGEYVPAPAGWNVGS